MFPTYDPEKRVLYYQRGKRYYINPIVYYIGDHSSGTSYYVDATSGSDTNSGTSKAAPWQTIAKVNASTFKPGDKILFKCGETWREQLNIPSSGAPGKPITITSYGSGNKPKIYGSTVPSSWTQETALYYTTQTVDPLYIWFIATDTTIHSGNKVALKANLAADYDWWWDDPNDRLYIYSASDPLTRYTSVEVGIPSITRGVMWVEDNHDYHTIDGLEVAFLDGAGIVSRNNATIINNYVHHLGGEDSSGGHSYGIEVNTGSNCIVASNTISDVWLAGIYVTNFYDPYISDNNIIEHNTVSDCKQWGIYLKGETNSASLKNNIIRYNNVYHTSGFVPTTNYGMGITLFGNAVAHEVGANSIYYNRVFVKKGAIFISTYVIGSSIYNNSLISTTGQGLWIDDTGTSGIIIKNNLVADATVYGLNIENVTCIAECDYNCWYVATGTVYARIGATSYHFDDFAAYKAATGFDTNSVWANPNITSAVTPDFNLQAGSPCINAGVALGFSADYTGKSVPQGAAPDIGAYEY
jgi:parallel beta-helix repeat protein